MKRLKNNYTQVTIVTKNDALMKDCYNTSIESKIKKVFTGQKKFLAINYI